jgi:hypothetical protein
MPERDLKQEQLFPARQGPCLGAVTIVLKRLTKVRTGPLPTSILASPI